MELRHLRYFLAVARTGHISRAAESLGLQQPPLSQQIRALEAELGLQLFHRHPKGVSLTEAGRVLHEEAARVLDEVAGLQRRMQGLAEGRRGTLRVGFTSSAAAHAFTPEALRACRQQHPDIELQVSENNAAEITEAIAASRLQCGFLRVPVARPLGVVFETLLHEPAVLAVACDHPLGRVPDAREPVPLRALQGEGLVLVRRPGAPGLYANLLACCAREGVEVRVVAEVERMMTNLNLVAAGAGLTVVPASMQGAHPHAVVYRPLSAPAELSAPLTLAFRGDECVGPTATFVTLVRALASSHGPSLERSQTGSTVSRPVRHIPGAS